jgi:DNA polymerase I-like protein with 3'-5' exonuclease and polymerase domains
MLDFSLKLVARPQDLTALAARLNTVPAMALDIETVNWWDRRVERVSLIQIAFREGARLRVAVIDALAGLPLEQFRPCLESSTVTKAIHNAAYDAVRLSHHYRIQTSPIHDTMLAARRGGEKRYSLQAQAETHLNVRLDKSEQRGDWAQRPLTLKQLRYAALDAACTLALYENQMARGLSAAYRLREIDPSTQHSLPLSDAAVALPAPGRMETPQVAKTKGEMTNELNAPATALLGVTTELAGRYSPERLAVSAGSERVGLAGWIIDGVLGAEMDIEEETARIVIAELLERELVSLNAARRLEATKSGARLWTQRKPV